MKDDPLPIADPATRIALDGITAIDFRANFALATAAGRSMSTMLRDVVRLRFGPGRLTSNEYYYYRLWEAGFTAAAQRSFVGKIAQNRMHLACNDRKWHSAVADKLAFHATMTDAGLPMPELLGIAHPHRSIQDVRPLATVEEIGRFLREPVSYPFFAKPIEGKYSLAVLNADRIDPATDTITLRGTPNASVASIAQALASRDDGFLIQRRLEPPDEVIASFGNRLWSVRLLVLLTEEGPVLHRATAKIPTGDNPADNYWRRGNLLGALDPATGRFERVVSGWADTLRVKTTHPDTGSPFTHLHIPRWTDVVELVTVAAPLLSGIGTQSWDIAITKDGPVILEANFGGDLSIAQIANGYGTLDATYRLHLQRHGYTRT